MIVEPADVSFADEVRGRDFLFIVAREAVPPFDGPGLGRVVPVAPYRKSYPFDTHEEHRRGGDRMLLVAREARVMLGYIAASRAWNGYVRIDDLAVDAPARRRGVGRRLMDAAVGWTRERAWPGVAVETQSTMWTRAASASGTASRLAALTATSTGHLTPAPARSRCSGTCLRQPFDDCFPPFR